MPKGGAKGRGRAGRPRGSVAWRQHVLADGPDADGERASQARAKASGRKRGGEQEPALAACPKRRKAGGAAGATSDSATSMWQSMAPYVAGKERHFMKALRTATGSAVEDTALVDCACFLLSHDRSSLSIRTKAEMSGTSRRRLTRCVVLLAQSFVHSQRLLAAFFVGRLARLRRLRGCWDIDLVQFVSYRAYDETPFKIRTKLGKNTEPELGFLAVAHGAGIGALPNTAVADLSSVTTTVSGIGKLLQSEHAWSMVVRIGETSSK